MAMSLATLRDELAAIVGPDHLAPGDPDRDALDGVAPRWVVAPGTAAEVAGVVQAANTAGAALAPRGGGTKPGWGNPPRRLDVVLSLARLDHLEEHVWADMTVTAQAGMPLAALQARLAEHGQRLALDPLFPERATLGGLIATNDSGPLRLRYGTLRDMLIGATIALPDGTLARAGGKVVKNVAGYDLCKLMIGALGTLGIVVAATFRVFPLPRQTLDLAFRLPDARAANALALWLLDSTAGCVAIQTVQAAGTAPELRLRLEGEPEAVAAQTAVVRRLTGAAPAAPATPPAEANAALWDAPADALIVKCSVVPTQTADLAAALAGAAESAGARWSLVSQAGGVALARCDGGDLAAALAAARSGVAELGGTLVALQAPLAVKALGDVWGAAGDALPLMQRIKAQFDPQGTLNPGRYIGGI